MFSQAFVLFLFATSLAAQAFGLDPRRGGGPQNDAPGKSVVVAQRTFPNLLAGYFKPPRIGLYGQKAKGFLKRFPNIVSRTCDDPEPCPEPVTCATERPVPTTSTTPYCPTNGPYTTEPTNPTHKPTERPVPTISPTPCPDKKCCCCCCCSKTKPNCNGSRHRNGSRTGCGHRSAALKTSNLSSNREKK